MVNDTDALVFHTPPQNQGQIVAESYAMADGLVICHRSDASDRTSEYFVSRALRDDEGDYWNAPPTNRRWRKMTAAELRRYGLSD